MLGNVKVRRALVLSGWIVVLLGMTCIRLRDRKKIGIVAICIILLFSYLSSNMFLLFGHPMFGKHSEFVRGDVQRCCKVCKKVAEMLGCTEVGR